MRYGILGVAQAVDDGGVGIPLGGPRLRALLAALALRVGRTVSAETLIDEVWGQDPPQDAPAALQALVGRLRRTVGKDAIVSGPGGYRLAATEDDVDLYVFERLVRRGTAALAHGEASTAAQDLTAALALWRGDALADLPDRTAATRPEALRTEATRARIEADLRLGRAQDVVPELRELTGAHPYDEPLHVLLIRALRDSGRGADALAAYETARRALADGLGTDPGPELREMHRELLTVSPGRPRVERSGNIRPRLTSFVGREPELDAIRSEVHRARLVTLTGPGGSGKTRLAEEAAAGLPQAWLVELAPLDRPEAVPGAVVSALGLRETVLRTTELTATQDDPIALLVEYCAPRSQLLILDNCEHVIEAAARLAETLLTRCPGLTVLATSREPLGVPGESVRPVEPLLPDQAHRLFAERAAAVRPDADAVLADEEAVGEICRRLDGLPLAIELAAARLRLLTPRQIADRLDDRFRLLTSGSRTVLPRQQTLRAVVDWSWELLDDRERTLLREVSVFAGGWQLEAAEAVCTGPAAELLGALVDKSLIVATPGGPDGMRYRMLETIHEYAVERAAECPELRAAAELRHRAWVRALVQEAEPQLRSAAQLPWISRLETELDNIRAAFDRTLLAGDEAEAGSLVLGVGWFWWLRNYRREGMTWVERVLRLGIAQDRAAATGRPHSPSDGEVEDPIDVFLATVGTEKHHPAHRRRMNLRMLQLFLRAETEPLDGDLDPRLRRYVDIVRDHFAQGGPDAARVPGIVWPMIGPVLKDPVDIRPLMDVAVAHCRAHGDDWAVAVSLMLRTHMTVDSPGGMTGVDDDLEELRVLSRRAGDRWLRAQVSSAAGEAAMARGRPAEARDEYEEALRLAHEVGAYAETPFLIARLAEVAYRTGDRSTALTTLDEASAAGDRYGVPETRAFVRLLRAHIALEDKDLVRARELVDAVREQIGQSPPPPQFTVMLHSIAAMLTAAESGPEHGLPPLVDTVREAIEKRCSDTVVAALVDGTATLLRDLGDLPRTARLIAAAEQWRGGYPRSHPECVAVERAQAEARTGLGPERYAAEHTRGTALTPPEALAELDEAVRVRSLMNT
ncbi:putative ATPase/DNA-binding SARP family transcriptional activator [Streptomyces sp. SAI-208]|uniref:BTAD domain-containing putative transcriptional regulator n=1 Tax=Streptomyces sp. SAI-208 TaxID=2940550 RepID=UPI0024760395|nr:BTAD domain-containing putative transcriptional regulator [Streptomyces sp. SAI-208]MDH6608937.1 putative ATPase/DNA-binding SARP family transcriptional activator [Streptomyces sp. SAI-208]